MTGPDEPSAAAVLAGEGEAIRQVQSWIQLAASGFRRKLDFEWDDLQQEFMLEVLEELRNGAWSGEGPLRAFVRRCVVHSCIDRVRYRDRWKMRDLSVVERRTHPSYADRTNYLALLDLARKLPDECRRMWRMIAEGLSYEEMAEALGVRAGTLRVRVLRCRRKATELRAEGAHSTRESQNTQGRVS